MNENEVQLIKDMYALIKGLQETQRAQNVIIQKQWSAVRFLLDAVKALGVPAPEIKDGLIVTPEAAS